MNFNHSNKKSDENEGQIMVITLLILTIIVIIVVSVVLVVGRDVEQQVTTREYEKYLDSAEQSIIDTISSFDIPNYELSELVNDPTLSCTLLGSEATCIFDDPDKSSRVVMTVRDSKDIEEYVLAKDEMFTMFLGGYDGIIRMSWTGETAMVYSLDFKRDGKFMSIKDVYDQKGIFTERGDDPLSGASSHAIAFRQYLPDFSISNEFVLSDTTGLLATDELVSLSFRPIIEDENTFTILDVVTSGTIDDQMRIYTATGFALDVEDFGESPAPTVVSKVPLYPQIPAIFDYVLLSPDAVVKN